MPFGGSQTNTGGHYLSDCNEAQTVPNDAALFENGNAVKAWAIDPVIAQKLWTASLDLLDQSFTRAAGS
jgi:hypothetical protein